MVAELVEDLTTLLADGAEALALSGDLTASRRHFEAAYQVAVRAGDHHAMSIAALGAGGIWVHEHRTAAGSAKLLARLGEALSSVDPRSPVGVRLRARLAAETDYRMSEYAKVLAMVDEARTSGDPVAVADALSIAHHCVLGPDHGPLRRELASDLLEESTHTARRIDLLMGMLWQTVDLFLEADTHAGRRLRELRGLLANENHLAVGFVADSIEVMLAIREGELGPAEQMSRECAERGREAGDADASAWHSAQMVTIRWYQGRIAELLPALRDLVNSPDLGAVDTSMLAALAVAAATDGDRRTATAAIAKLRGQDLAELPRSSTWLVTMNGVVEAAHLLGDVGTSARAYELLRPFADLPMMASLAVACFGSVHHALGVASMTIGDQERSVGHFRVAVQQNLALEHWPAVVMSRLRHAQALEARGLPSDAANAQQEFAAAAADTEAIALSARSTGGIEPSGRTAVCVRHGQRWKIELGARTVGVEHSVGLLHLAVLTANPGQEVDSIDLVAGVSELRRVRAGMPISSQPMLDRVAIQNYRNRVQALNTEIDKWEERGDRERAAQARAERDWILSELSAATGIGGDPRRFSDSHERARIAVGKAIRRSLARVSAVDPTIGEHLRSSIHTGIRCSYRPAELNT